jgi:hypothetical protein
MAGQLPKVAQAVADAPLGSVLSWTRRRAGSATRWLYGSTGAESAVGYGAGVKGRQFCNDFNVSWNVFYAVTGHKSGKSSNRLPCPLAPICRAETGPAP